MLFHFYRIAPKKVILKQWEYWCFLTLVTVHIVVATGDPLSALYIWKMDLQVVTAVSQFAFHVLTAVFFFFSLYFLCAPVALFEFSFNVLFMFQCSNCNAKMHLCFSDIPENICIYICVHMCMSICAHKCRYVLEKMLFSRKVSKISKMCLLMMSSIQQNSK